MTDSWSTPPPIVLVVDTANVVGSVPDGWWRDRVGASERLLGGLVALCGRILTGPDGDPVRVGHIVAVLEGEANRAVEQRSRESTAPEIIRATGSGDDAIVDLVMDRVAAGDPILLVSADRGLRARLPPGVATTGPSWLNGVLGRGPAGPRR